MLQPQTSNPFQNVSMDNPSRRSFTFSNWPLKTQVWPTQLSNAGFFYNGEGTKIQCFSCGVITSVDNWQRGARPEVVHFLLNNDCKYIRETYPIIKDEIKYNDLAARQNQTVESGIIPAIRTLNMDPAENSILYNSALCNAVCKMEINNNITNKPEDCLSAQKYNGACEPSIRDSVEVLKAKTSCPTKVIDNIIHSSDGTSKPVLSQEINKMTHHCLANRNYSHVLGQNVSVPNGISGTQKSKINRANDSCGSVCPQTLQDTDKNMYSFCAPSSSLSIKYGRIPDGFRLPEKDLYTIPNKKETLKPGILDHSEVSSASNSSLNNRTSIDRIYDSYQIPFSATNSFHRNKITNKTEIISAVLNRSIHMDQGAAASGYNEFQSSTYEPDFSFPDYRHLQKRLLSFRTWPSSAQQSPHLLAESGCFYTGQNDVVRCFCCNLGLSEWTADDNPWTEHARHNPRCWFLRNEKGQEFIDSIQREWKTRYKPKNPAFDDFTSRLATFDGWRDDIEQTPQILADAGFFYTGETDVVRCHYCDGGLRNWEQGDIPWEEHARWFPKCKYIIKMKGCRYIEEIKAKYNRQQAIANNNSGQEDGSENQLATAAAKNVIKMGIPISTVKSSINNFIKTNVLPHQVRSLEDERDPAKLRIINDELKKNLLCVICKKNEKCMLFTNCGHRVTCENCCPSLKYCPHCDTRIKKVIKTFLS